MKIINNPTIELEEKDIETLEGFRKLIIDMFCSRSLCKKCPFNTICELMDVNEPIESMVLNIRKAWNNALKK